MDDFLDVVLFPFALLAGGILFLLGKRYLQTDGRGRLLHRFVLLTSVVLVFLGGVIDEERAWAQDDSVYDSPQTGKESPLNSDPQWRRIRTLWNDIRASVSSGESCPTSVYAGFESGLAAARKWELTSLGGSLDSVFKDFVVFHLESSIGKLKLDFSGSGFSEETQARKLIETLRIHGNLLAALEEAKLFDREIGNCLEDALDDAFTDAAHVPFAVRLTSNGISDEDYKNLLGGVIDGSFKYCRNCPAPKGPAVSPDEPRIPSVKPMYGVDEVPGPVSEYGVTDMPVSRPKYGVMEFPPPEPGPQEPAPPVPDGPPVDCQPEYGVRMTRPGRSPVTRSTYLRRRADVSPGQALVGSILGIISVRQAGGAWVQLLTGNSIFLSSTLENPQGVPAKFTIKGAKEVPVGGKSVLTGWEIRTLTGIPLPSNF